MILSSSYGRKNNSKVLIFPISKTNTYLNPTYSFCCPPMLEQISVDNNNAIILTGIETIIKNVVAPTEDGDAVNK